MPIKIIGTSHIAKESVAKIKKEILHFKPEIVAVELDANRIRFLFSKKRKFQLSAIRTIGFTGFLFSLIGSFAQRKLGERVGLFPGADMRAAIQAARKINSKIFLIDLPIGVTLRRISQNMSLFEKIKFIGFLLGGFIFSTSPELKEFDLNKVPNEKLISALIRELRKRFPKLYKVLIEDRDKYMAEQIIRLLALFPNNKILVVVGAGHISGIKKHLKAKGVLLNNEG